MANLTRIKILTTGATTAAPSNIKTGELAYSYVLGTQAIMVIDYILVQVQNLVELHQVLM